jgi:outer membrane protein, multidrug efflux system
MKKFLPLTLLAACTLGPNYETPEVCLPCHFEGEVHTTSSVDLATWWKQFEDPLLDELIDEALCCNYDLRIALHKIEEVRGLYRIDRSILYPQIQGNMVAVRSRRSANLGSDVIEETETPSEILPTDFSGPLIQNFFQLGLDASWELDFFGKNRRKAEAALRDLEASEEAAIDVQISLIGEVALRYIDLRSLQERIQSQEEQIQSQKELLSLAQTRYDAGLTSYLDVSRAEVRLNLAESNLPPLQEARKQTLNALAVLLGRPPEAFCVGEGKIPLALDRLPCELPSTLLCRRPDIRKAERELAAATARIGAAKAELFPTFSLIGSFGTQANLLEDVFAWPSRFWTIGPSMVWNLFTGGRLIAQIKVTNERQKQALLAYEKTIQESLREVEDRLVGYLQENRRLFALEEQLANSSFLRDLSLEQYVSGLISFDNVLDAETALYISQKEMIQSKGALMVQLIGLYKSLGGGWQCLDSP